MHIVVVDIHVKPENLEEFIHLTVENATNSRLEAGVVRFDVLQQKDDPTRFVLYEVYRNAEGQAAHRDSAHYKKWRSAVEEMMAEPRKGTVFVNLSPVDGEW